MSSSGHHESFHSFDEAKEPSERDFGLTLGAVLLGLAILRGWRRGHWSFPLFALALALGGAALVRPSLLRPANRAWTRLGRLLAKITQPVFLGFAFYGVLTPFALLMKLWRRDPLRRQDWGGTAAREAKTYWIDLTGAGASGRGTLKDPF